MTSGVSEDIMQRLIVQPDSLLLPFDRDVLEGLHQLNEASCTVAVEG
jgi:hypothetical protein